jgi:hypothetical protein
MTNHELEAILWIFLHLGDMVTDPDRDWQALNADTDPATLCQSDRIRIKQPLLSSIIFMFWASG